MRFFGLFFTFAIAGCGSSSPGVTDAACGTTMNAVVGEKFDVTLASTYWTFQPTSDPTVVTQEGTTQVASSGNCVPGGGCGTAKATFDAVGPGTATINASRTSCGEAMGCGPGQGQGICTITVTVTP